MIPQMDFAKADWVSFLDGNERLDRNVKPRMESPISKILETEEIDTLKNAAGTEILSNTLKLPNRTDTM